MAARHDASPTALIAARDREASKPGRLKKSGRGSGATPKVKSAIELLVFGELEPKDRLRQAAEGVGLSVRALRAAMLKPAVDTYYKQQLANYRNGLKASALNTVENIMADPQLMNTAAGAKVRLDAAKTALNDDAASGISVHVNTQVNVTPGYVIDLTDHGPLPEIITVENI